MLRIIVPSAELWDEVKQEFIHTKEYALQLEHSLVSISKWESRWCKAFLTDKQKTYEETVDYIRCMTLTQNVPPIVYDSLTKENFEQIDAYIDSPMTAVYFSQSGNTAPNRDTITAELIYYWMIGLNIPFECQKWHLNRLFALIRVCEIKNKPPKRNVRDVMKRNSSLNMSRRKMLGSKG